MICLSKPRVVIITTKTKNCNRLIKYFEELLGNIVDIDGYSLESGIDKYMNCNIVLVPNHLVALGVMSYLLPQTEVVIMKRTILRSTWEKVIEQPTGTRVLLVNSSYETALQYSSMLYELGASHLKIHPYNPHEEMLLDIDVVFHPNELDMVPHFSKNIVNLGDSEVDISTFVDILSRLNILNNKAREAFHLHMERTMPSSPGILSILNNITWNTEYLEILVNTLDQCLIAFNEEGKIRMFNRHAKKIFHPVRDTFYGLSLSDILSQEVIEEIFDKNKKTNTIVEINNNEYLLDKYFLKKKGLPAGGLIILRKHKNVNEQKKSLLWNTKGHKAKYTFNDILGRSQSLSKVISFGKIVAAMESDILIEGESGTGKELFAHAIHNASPRKKGPFVAFNCAALSSTLLESELFGYEKGAFTGAQLTGKPGMFELADGGTIFLDEIGEISKEIQIKLLRVLQEREVMRVGGIDLVKVDIRVISATNKNLFKLARAGVIRDDLYFRLNVVNIRIPPLRERKEDIPYIIKNFLAEKNIKIDIPREFLETCMRFNWYGNVREVKNCIEYMINKGCNFTEENLPEYLLSQEKEYDSLSDSYSEELKMIGDPYELYAVLAILKEAKMSNYKIGRNKLSQILAQRNIKITEQETRTILKKLEKAGYVLVRKGRAGSIITQKGLKELGKQI